MSIQVYDSGGYLQIPGTPGPQSFAHVGPTAPSNPEVGQMWVPDDKYLIDQWDDDWQYPVLLNGWVEYNTAAYGNVRYRKCPGGLVIVDGMVKNGTVGNIDAPLFVLPEGYRPVGAISTYGCNVNQNPCRILINYRPGYFQIHAGDPYWVNIHSVFAV